MSRIFNDCVDSCSNSFPTPFGPCNNYFDEVMDAVVEADTETECKKPHHEDSDREGRGEADIKHRIYGQHLLLDGRNDGIVHRNVIVQIFNLGPRYKILSDGRHIVDVSTANNISSRSVHFGGFLTRLKRRSVPGIRMLLQ